VIETAKNAAAMVAEMSWNFILMVEDCDEVFECFVEVDKSLMNVEKVESDAVVCIVDDDPTNSIHEKK